MRPRSIIMMLALVGCGDDPPVATPGTTSSMTDSTSTGDPPVDTTMPDSTGPMVDSTGRESTSSSSTTATVEMTSSTTAVDSSSSGEPGGPCVDINIGSNLGNGVAEGATAGSGDDFHLEDCEVGADPFAGPDYVVEWTAPRSGMYTFTLVDSDFDTVLGVFPPTCGNESAYECNDDCESFTSAIGYNAEAGETLYIVIEGYWGTDGNFRLDIYDGVEPDCCSGETWEYCGGSTWSGGTWGSGSTSFWGSSSGGWDTDTSGGWNSSGSGGWDTSGGFIIGSGT